jgi:hypothetical protein
MIRGLPPLARLALGPSGRGGKVGLGPFWTLVQVLLYNDVVHVFVSSSASSFRHTCIATVGKFYTRTQM